MDPMHWLLQHRENRTSQFGEEGMLWKVFERLREGPGWCVECGAWDGLEMSNTAELIRNRGWRGVLIEADDVNFSHLLANYQGFPGASCLHAGISKANGLDAVLALSPIPSSFDLLVLDIDGSEYWAWLEMRRYRPRVVLIEINPSFGHEYRFIPKRNAFFIGSSLRSMVDLGAALGYRLAALTDVNCLFVDQRDFPRLEPLSADLDAHYAALWSGRPNPWLPRTCSDYSGNHFLLAPSPWNSGKVASLGTEADLRKSAYDPSVEFAEDPIPVLAELIPAAQRCLSNADLQGARCILKGAVDLAGSAALPRTDQVSMWKAMLLCDVKLGDRRSAMEDARLAEILFPGEPELASCRTWIDAMPT